MMRMPHKPYQGRKAIAWFERGAPITLVEAAGADLDCPGSRANARLVRLVLVSHHIC